MWLYCTVVSIKLVPLIVFLCTSFGNHDIVRTHLGYSRIRRFGIHSFLGPRCVYMYNFAAYTCVGHIWPFNHHMYKVDVAILLW